MRKHFVAIVGHGGSGKSTVIQSLTGAKSKGYVGTVEDRSSGKELEVMTSSPEENNELSLQDVREMLEKAKRSDVSLGAVIAIQPRGEDTQKPMERIFELARRYRFTLHAFVLDPPYSSKKPRRTTIEEIEDRIRRAGVKCQRLDGRRFALHNAAIIRETVGLF